MMCASLELIFFNRYFLFSWMHRAWETHKPVTSWVTTQGRGLFKWPPRGGWLCVQSSHASSFLCARWQRWEQQSSYIEKARASVRDETCYEKREFEESDDIEDEDDGYIWLTYDPFFESMWMARPSNVSKKQYKILSNKAYGAILRHINELESAADDVCASLELFFFY
jgi:hypothetical protein